ncbi:MAG: glycosyltransferase family 2 protein [Pseudomonadales bacterium]
MDLIFGLSTFLVLYMFVGYPLVLAFAVKLSSKNKNASSTDFAEYDNDPGLSVVIAAYNEEQNIVRRISNLLEQNYDLSKLQIIVGSDGSVDSTVSLLEEQKIRAEQLGVSFQIMAFSERRGKPRILNEALLHCEHDFVLFADVRQTFSQDTLRNICRGFSDPNVGAVSGELFLREPTDVETVADMGLYWRYEKLVRKLEAKLHSTVGATGAIYAIRKNLFQPIPERTLIDDVVIPMQICLQGYRVLFADNAQAFDVAPTDTNKEWLRKVRTLAGNWQLLSIRPGFLNPFKNPVWPQFISHKMLRLALPFCLLAMFISSYLVEGDLHSTMFTLQCLVYAIGVAAFFSENLRRMRIPGLIYFFCILNAAILVGFYRLASGNKEGLWSFAYKAEH